MKNELKFLAERIGNHYHDVESVKADVRGATPIVEKAIVMYTQNEDERKELQRVWLQESYRAIVLATERQRESAKMEAIEMVKSLAKYNK